MRITNIIGIRKSIVVILVAVSTLLCGVDSIALNTTVAVEDSDILTEAGYTAVLSDNISDGTVQTTDLFQQSNHEVINDAYMINNAKTTDLFRQPETKVTENLHIIDISKPETNGSENKLSQPQADPSESVIIALTPFGEHEYYIDGSDNTLHKKKDDTTESVITDRQVLGIYQANDTLFASTLDGDNFQEIVVVAYLKQGVDVLAEKGAVPIQPRLSAAEVRRNEKQITSYLTDTMGMNDAAASGILANIYAESGFDPNALGDGGTSYGICQWHDTSVGDGRWVNLKNYCNSQGYDWTSLDGQLRFMRYELSNSYPDVLNYIRSVDISADSAYNAAYYWCFNYERPANKEKVADIRGNTALNTYWPKFAPQIPPAPPTNVRGEKKLYSSQENITLNWDSSPLAINYWIYVWKDDVEIYSTNMGRTMTFTSAPTSAGLYSFLVKAENKFGFSDIADYTFIVYDTKPSAPTINNSSKLYPASESITFDWVFSPTATNYIINLWKDGTAVNNTDIKDETSFTSAPLRAGEYTFIVRAGNSFGYSDITSYTFTVYDTKPSAPTITSTKNEYSISESITLDWSVSPLATSYWICMWKDGAIIYNEDNIETTSYTFTPANAGKYTFAVRAGNGFGYSDDNKAYSFTVNDPANVSTAAPTAVPTVAPTAVPTIASTAVPTTIPAVQYSVFYNANTGTGAPENQIKIQSNPLTLSSTIPTQEGYMFLGWAETTDAKTAQYQPGDTFTKDTDVTLYAVWSKAGS